MEKWLGWAHKLGGTESLGFSMVGQTVLSRLKESQVWHQSPGSVAVLGGRVQKRDNGLCPPSYLGESCPLALILMPDTSVSPCMPLVPLKLLPWCWSSEGVSLSKFIYVFFKKNTYIWDSRIFFYHLNPTGFCSQKLWGLIFLALEPWAGGA